MNAQKAVNLLCTHLLGEDWYIVDPVGNEEANDIIVEAIMKMYPPKTMTRIDKWRKRHKKCRWCTHCHEDILVDDVGRSIGIGYTCKAKCQTIFYVGKSRPFCTLFNLKKEKENANS